MEITLVISIITFLILGFTYNVKRIRNEKTNYKDLTCIGYASLTSFIPVLNLTSLVMAVLLLRSQIRL